MHQMPTFCSEYGRLPCPFSRDVRFFFLLSSFFEANPSKWQLQPFLISALLGLFSVAEAFYPPSRSGLSTLRIWFNGPCRSLGPRQNVDATLDATPSLLAAKEPGKGVPFMITSPNISTCKFCCIEDLFLLLCSLIHLISIDFLAVVRDRAWVFLQH